MTLVLVIASSAAFTVKTSYGSPVMSAMLARAFAASTASSAFI